jgi:hypothetical protein
VKSNAARAYPLYSDRRACNLPSEERTRKVSSALRRTPYTVCRPVQRTSTYKYNPSSQISTRPPFSAVFCAQTIPCLTLVSFSIEPIGRSLKPFRAISTWTAHQAPEKPTPKAHPKGVASRKAWLPWHDTKTKSGLQRAPRAGAGVAKSSAFQFTYRVLCD